MNFDSISLFVIFVVIPIGVFVYFTVSSANESRESALYWKKEYQKIEKEIEKYKSDAKEAALQTKNATLEMEKAISQTIKKYKAIADKATLHALDSIKKKEVAENELRLHATTMEKFLNANVTLYPFLAGVIADYMTYDLEILAKGLDWGHDEKRLKKVRSIRELRSETKTYLQDFKLAQYQLDYILNL